MNPEIEDGCRIAADVKIWAGTIVRSGAVIGPGSSIGRDVYIGPGVLIGSSCKIQNNALIYEPAHLADGVFIGPGVILTNDRNPRARTPSDTPKTEKDWDKVAVKIGRDASIGAGAICVAPLEIGSWAMVAAGSVVTRDVPKFALVAGVPARRIGWVGKGGIRLTRVDNGEFQCPETGARFLEEIQEGGNLTLVEKAP